MNRKMISKLLYSGILVIFLLTACSNEDMDAIDENMFSGEEDDVEQLMQMDYEFPFGPNDLDMPVKINGDKLEYELYIDNQENAAEFGIMVVMDGIPQMSTLENTYSIMHKVYLDRGQYEVYKFVIDRNDLTINKGDEHIVYPLIVLEPDYIPTDRKHFVHEGKLSASKGIKFTYAMEKEPDINNTYVEPVKLDAQLKSKYNIKKNTGLENTILWSLDKTNNAFISLEDVSNEFDVNLVGDDIGETRVFLFVNNKPVKINEYDCYETTIQPGMVTSVNVQLDKNLVSELKNEDSIFVISIPQNLESVEAWPCKTRTKILEGIRHE